MIWPALARAQRGATRRIDRRTGAVDGGLLVRHANELVASNPEAIVCATARVAYRLMQETSTIPIILVSSPEQTIKRLAPDFSRPGGNLTGFINFVDSMPAKWLQLLSEIDPQIGRVAIVYDPECTILSVRS